MILLDDTFWEVKEIKNKGKGVFAKNDILQKTIIGDYLGTFLRPEEAVVDESNFYLMYYSDRAVIAPDLNISGVHLLNNSCEPNAWLYVYKGHTLAFAIKNIKKGEEITIPYLLSPKTKFCNPCQHVCFCGSKNCTGTMHISEKKYKKWRRLTDKQAKETKKEKVRYGKQLEPLLVYPKITEEYIDDVNKLNNI